MRNGFLGVVATILASAAAAWAQVGPGDPLPAQLPGGIAEGYDSGPQGMTSPNVPPNFAGFRRPLRGHRLPASNELGGFRPQRRSWSLPGAATNPILVGF